MTSPHPNRRVLLAGSTGLVGGFLLQGLLADASVAEVHALARRPIGVEHARLRVHVVDFTALPDLPPVDEAYLALGTTLKVAGSRAAFRAVDLDANLAVAHAAVRAGARRIGLVSAAGASARSSVFYNRVKGELETALTGLDLDALATSGERQWVTGQVLRVLWFWIHNSPPTLQFAQSSGAFRVALEIPSVTRDSPPPPQG